MFETTCRVCSLKAHIGFGRVHPWIFHASRNAALLLWLGLGSQFPEPLHKLLSLSLRLEIRYVHLHCLNVVNKVHVQASYVIPFPSSHRFRMLSTWLCSCRWCFCIADAASDVGCQLCPFSDWVAHEQMSLLWILEPQWSGEVESLLECCPCNTASWKCTYPSEEAQAIPAPNFRVNHVAIGCTIHIYTWSIINFLRKTAVFSLTELRVMLWRGAWDWEPGIWCSISNSSLATTRK